MRFLSNTMTCCTAVTLGCLCLFGLGKLSAEETGHEGAEASFSNPEFLPIVNFTFPNTALQQVSGTINVTINAAAVNGIASIEFLLDGVSQGTVTKTPYEFPLNTTTLSNGLHVLTAVASDTTGDQSAQTIDIYTLNNFTPILVNCGGGMVTYEGTTYHADEDFSFHSSTFLNPSIPGNPVYQTERFGKNFSYNFPLDPCKFLLTLQFEEIYFTEPDKRVFNVAVNGQNVITDLDLVKAVGYGNPYVVEIPVTIPTNTLNIRFKSVVNHAKISAIQITASPQ